MALSYGNEGSQASREVPLSVQERIKEEEQRVKGLFGDRPRRILIIGGAGYVGGPLTTELLRRGYQVRHLDLLLYGQQNGMLGHLMHPAYEFQYGDLCSPSALDRALEDVTDVIVLAGLVGDPITKKYPTESEAINDVGIRECINRLNGRGLNKLIFVSTCSNYGFIEEDALADEDYDLKPLSLYAKAKVAAEKYIESQCGATDYHPTILRFATAFGLAPRMRFDLTVNEFARELFLGNQLEVYDAQTWRPYCHVKDFAAAMLRVLEFPADEVSFETFNVGGDFNNHTKQSIVDLICSRLPGREVVYRSHSSDQRNYKVSFSKLRSKLYFEPSYTVGDGIGEILWAHSNRLFENAGINPNYYGNYKIVYEVNSHGQLAA